MARRSLVLVVIASALAGCPEDPPAGGGTDASGPADARVFFADAAGGEDAAPIKDAGESDAGGEDTGVRDLGVADAEPEDVGFADAEPEDVGFADAEPEDVGFPDAEPEDVGFADATVPDLGFPDAAPPDLGFPDAAPPDLGFPDASPPDLGFPDAAPPDAGTVACTNGGGRVLWRLTFPNNNGGYARVEEWQAACAYSLANPACSLSGEPHDYANWGPGVVFNSSRDFFRVRFSVAGLSFTSATLYIAAHADGSGIPNAVLESPLYGSLQFAPTVPISQHRTYAVNWSSYLSPSDAPSLTAVTLRSMPTGLAVSEIELCIQ